MQKINVIKVGGAVVEGPQSLRAMLNCFAKIPEAKILVHGGGRSATALAARLGIESKMMGGRRVTDEAMLDVVTMVYGGLVNKHIVSALQSVGVNAIGLTGADAGLILSHRRPLMTQADGSLVDFGYVGDVDKVNAEVLSSLLASGLVPVIAPLTYDGEGKLLNTNADTIASEVAKALAKCPDSEVTLTYCFEKKGVLANAEAEASVIPEITLESFYRLKADGVISGGMLPKIENALEAVSGGVSKVVITRFDSLDGGTVIC